MPTAWNLNGTYFESCNCDVACPCVFLSDPTNDDCTVLIAWHIEKGKFGTVGLDGLNVALALYSPGNMLKVKWEAALYLDSRADKAQQDALGKIFGGQAGGEPAALAPFIGKLLGVKAVPISYQAQGKERSLKIPKIAEMEIKAIDGQGGHLVTIENHPLTGVPNQTAVVAKSTKLSLHDHGLNWEVSGKNGFYSPFSFKGS